MTTGARIPAPAPLAAPEETAIAEALARNDAYVQRFVEALGMCPYARRCRETGRLHRRVLLSAGGAPASAGFAHAVQDAARAVQAIDAMPADAVEVALLVFPALDGALARGTEGARAFEQLCAALRDELQAAHGRAGTAPPFYCVAFHPDLPEDLSDEHRAVSFIRRSPDPTLQLVRRSVLEAVRGEQGSTFVDASRLSLSELLAVASPLSVSDRIARANLATLRAEGPDRVRALLASLRG
jgi:hypothetical protein